MFVISFFIPLKMAPVMGEKVLGGKYSAFLNLFHPEVNWFIQRLERIKDKTDRSKVSIIVYKTYLKEKMLPNTYSYIYIYACVCVHTYICICIHMHTYTYMYTCTYINRFVSVQYMYLHYIYKVKGRWLYICVWVHIYIYIYIYTHTHTERKRLICMWMYQHLLPYHYQILAASISLTLILHPSLSTIALDKSSKLHSVDIKQFLLIGQCVRANRRT